MFRIHSIKSAIRISFIPRLTTDEATDLPLETARTRASILELESRINVSRANLLTICRCIKGMVPPLCTTSKIYSGIFGVFDLLQAIADLEERCSRITLDQQDLLCQQHVRISTPFPKQVIEKPVVVPHSERIISPPRSLSRAYIVALRMTASGSYHLLKVKKQELKIELDKLEADIKRWGDIYAQMMSTESEIQNQYTETHVTSPVLTPMSLSSSHSTLANSEAGSYFHFQRPKSGIFDPHCENTMFIKRKAVPVKEIVSRTLQSEDQLRSACPC